MGVEIFFQTLAKGLINGWISCEYIHLNATGESKQEARVEIKKKLLFKESLVQSAHISKMSIFARTEWANLLQQRSVAFLLACFPRAAPHASQGYGAQ